MKLQDRNVGELKGAIKLCGLSLKSAAEHMELRDSALANGFSSNNRRSIPDEKLLRLVDLLTDKAEELSYDQSRVVKDAAASLNVLISGVHTNTSLPGDPIENSNDFYLARERETLECVSELDRGNSLLSIIGGPMSGRSAVVRQCSYRLQKSQIMGVIQVNQFHDAVWHALKDPSQDDLLRLIASLIEKLPGIGPVDQSGTGTEYFWKVLNVAAESKLNEPFPHIVIEGVERFFPDFANKDRSATGFFTELSHFRRAGVRLGLVFIFDASICTNEYASKWIFSTAPFSIVESININELRSALSNKYKIVTAEGFNQHIFDENLYKISAALMSLSSGHVFLVHLLVFEMADLNVACLKEAVEIVATKFSHALKQRHDRKNPINRLVRSLSDALIVAHFMDDQDLIESSGHDEFNTVTWLNNLNMRWADALKLMSLTGGENYSCEAAGENLHEVFSRLAIENGFNFAVEKLTQRMD